MGIPNGLTGCGALYGELLGGSLGFGGVPTHPAQLAAMQQQQAMFDPFAFQRQQQLLEQIMMRPYPHPSPRPIKHVESQEVTPRERARKQINGAVQAVKDAQIAAKSYL